MESLSYNFIFRGIPHKFLIFLLFFTYFGTINWAIAQTKGKIDVVVIDPGHGGKDPGAPGVRVNEKDVVLGISLKLGNLINKNLPDVKVIYTRETDVFVELRDRPPIANKNQADLFISIHANANRNSEPSGVETFIMGEAKSKDNLDVVQKENSVILLEDNYSTNYEGFDPNSPESYIMFSLFQNAYQEQSLHFASYVQSQLKNRARRTDRGVKQGNLWVLWKTVMPSVLIETGFISNPEEAKFLKSEQGQYMIATAIFQAFKNYKHDLENRSMRGNNHHGNSDSVLAVAKDKGNEPDETSPPPQNDSIPEKQMIEFAIQISSSKKPIVLKKQNFKGLENVEEIKVNDNFKYIVGRKVSYKEVLAQSKIIKNYFPDAFVIALSNGKIIPVRDALKEIKD